MNILRSIAHCNDLDLLKRIQKAATDRMKLLCERAHEEALASKWDEAKTWKPGTTLYCAAQGIFLGGSIQRGDRFVVYSIQPRKKRLWTKRCDKDGNVLQKDGQPIYLWFAPAGLVRYAIQTAPSEQPPVDPVERKLASDVGKIVEGELP